MKNLLISFSGGETSAFMLKWLWDHCHDRYNMVVVFANTGQENEETLKFVYRVSVEFNIPIVWVEASVNQGRKGTGFNIVNFQNASRDGQPFEQVIRKYGIPNKAYPHCTRELKLAPIHSFIKSIGWRDYYTAIGIRSDEFDRMNPKHEELRIIYPLISKDFIPMTKPKINFWWSQQKFRLELKGYQGNCITCWKKSDKKLYTIAKENEKHFNFFGLMEARYDRFIPESRVDHLKRVRFFRGNRSVQDIIEESKNFNEQIKDDSDIYEESCDIYSNCGDI